MKDLIFVGDTRRVLSGFPDPVQRHVGYALYQAQLGNKHLEAKPLKGFAGGVLEVVSDHRGDTFRTVYTSGWSMPSTSGMPFRKSRSRASQRPKVKSSS
jgi:phage-related protein